MPKDLTIVVFSLAVAIGAGALVSCKPSTTHRAISLQVTAPFAEPSVVIRKSDVLSWQNAARGSLQVQFQGFSPCEENKGQSDPFGYVSTCTIQDSDPATYIYVCQNGACADPEIEVGADMGGGKTPSSSARVVSNTPIGPFCSPAKAATVSPSNPEVPQGTTVGWAEIGPKAPTDWKVTVPTGICMVNGAPSTSPTIFVKGDNQSCAISNVYKGIQTYDVSIPSCTANPAAKPSLNITSPTR